MKKESLPYSNAVSNYYHENPTEFLNINVGKHAQRESEWDAMYPNEVKPSLYLPYMHDFMDYWWPVKGLTIVLRWKSNSSRQIEFANYLVNICGAACVFTIINDELVKFSDITNNWRHAA